MEINWDKDERQRALPLSSKCLLDLGITGYFHSIPRDTLHWIAQIFSWVNSTYNYALSFRNHVLSFLSHVIRAYIERTLRSI